MKKGMDLFGEALQSYYRGDRTRFYFELFDKKNGIRFSHPLSKYFRTGKQLHRLENKIISLSRGEILDVGCGPGNFIPHLNKKGNVLGIDISPKVILVCNERGYSNVKVADIFSFKIKKKFDTIVLMENNFGMAQTVPRVKKMLKLLKNMLTENGQILSNVMRPKSGDYFAMKMRVDYKGKKGDWISWINLNSGFLSKLCREVGLKMEILGKDGYYYLVRITK